MIKIQTFLPYSDFDLTAKCLDAKRLGKQRLECIEILVILSGEQPKWMSDKWYARCMRHKNHPAVNMWRGFEKVLCEYAYSIIREWKNRGYRDTCRDKVLYLEFNFFQCESNSLPKLFNKKEFHLAHQSNLVRKLPKHYRKYFPHIPDNLPYIWSV